jgi:RimJ/RimL family protein N-acetyltransferase
VRIDAPSRVEGERAALRDPRASDAEPYVQAFADDPGLERMMGFPAPSRTRMRREFRGERRDREAGRVLGYTITARGEDAFAGSILLHSFHWEHRRADVGVLLAPAARGRGLALEALRLLVALAFARLGLQRVGLATIEANAPTLRLAERAGFAREGVLRAYTRELGAPVDNVVYGALPGDAAWA